MSMEETVQKISPLEAVEQALADYELAKGQFHNAVAVVAEAEKAREAARVCMGSSDERLQRALTELNNSVAQKRGAGVAVGIGSLTDGRREMMDALDPYAAFRRELEEKARSEQDRARRGL